MQEKDTQQVVMITQVFHPDTQATSQLLSALAQALSSNSPPHLHKNSLKSFDLTVLTSYPSNARGHHHSQANLENWSGITVRRGGLAIDAKKSLGHRALSYFSYLIWLFCYLLFKVKSTDKVLVVTNPPFAPLIVWGATGFRSVINRSFSYWILLHDLYPDGLLALGSIKIHWWVKLWIGLNRKAFHRAHQVITLGRDMSQYCHTHYQIPFESLVVIPNWSPVAFEGQPRLQPNETALWQSLPAQAQKENIVIIQYSGNMGLWHNMEGIVETAHLLRDLPMHFLMIGDGRRKSSAQNKAKNLGLDNMTWLPFQPLDSLTDSLQCAHMSLVSQRTEVLGIMVPSKLYGILASRRAVIAQVPLKSEVALTIQEHNCGIVLETDDPHLLAEHLRKLYLEPAQIQAMGQSAGQAYETNYSFEKAVGAFRKTLSSL